ncbi:MAG TPA: tRNA preQ1(34) S-adenosylmethionine ribosyltransferase-isomerase QueA [Terriglobales bacterium]|nr:tRNA preQ1(34) S-adenosylmethionine ribosyltransferase-isomerase QueA [Terriglobales bacterium]
MLVSDFNFHLPEELIAKEPLADRAASRMLHVCRDTGAFEDRLFRELPDLLRSDDLLVFNNTRVFPARLYGRRGGLHAQKLSSHNPAMRDFLKGKVEVLLTKRVDGGGDQQTWEALVRPGRKIGVGEHLYFGEDHELHAEVIARGEFGERTLRFSPVADFFGLVERLGHVPLPPYMGREDRPEDRERYQTVYARERGSVAAPTAGLHFTAEVLDRLHARGIETAEITLHVGLGTFQPVHVAVVEEHKLHREWYSISEQTAAAINRAMDDRRRVVAVGTTTVRTLEYAALVAPDARPHAGSGEADIFIYPGFQFRVIGGMLTNFHLPESTLLMLVSAFAGRDKVLSAYEHAVEEKYRFYSYGDCMFVE